MRGNSIASDPPQTSFSIKTLGSNQISIGYLYQEGDFTPVDPSAPESLGEILHQ